MKISIVNEQDEVIGHKDIGDRNPEEIIRITALWLWNEKGEVLLAQRAFSKESSPGLWGPAVAGRVEQGETYESNIIKEAEEEIGLKGLRPTPERKLRRDTSHSYFGQWFVATINSDYPLVKQDSEVEAIKWFNKEELFKALEETPEMFLPSMQESARYYFNNETKS